MPDGSGPIERAAFRAVWPEPSGRPCHMRAQPPRIAAAEQLARAIDACDPRDAVQVIDHFLPRLMTGAPRRDVWADLRDEARFWAITATEAELKQYLLASFAALPRHGRIRAIGALQAEALR